MGSVTTQAKRWRGQERRSGKDRRQSDGVLPTGVERRCRVEPRKIDVVELFFSPYEWDLMKLKWSR